MADRSGWTNGAARPESKNKKKEARLVNVERWPYSDPALTPLQLCLGPHSDS
eukprot:CAMPEP_0196653136 /NCGR_PEP_ID=MMETSP1086-20130531/2740_1 /TAXON_ID=77921 /ORGANISM="Cyanoptyche  gloeocystis , Strain SAG4.97" /LENGTH=51 /DNA_ID=CAMNT_0041984175 /DNA_START=1 /DNA_END=152 /DNA_ORIENTATION=+